MSMTINVIPLYDDSVYAKIPPYLVMIITVRNSSCGKVMFSQACVKNSVHRGEGGCIQHALGQTPRVGIPACTGSETPTPLPGKYPSMHWGRPLGRYPSIHWSRQPRQADTPDGHCSGRYAPYWNAFLLNICSQVQMFLIGS